jgi:hypothetical protein
LLIEGWFLLSLLHKFFLGSWEENILIVISTTIRIFGCNHVVSQVFWWWKGNILVVIFITFRTLWLKLCCCPSFFFGSWEKNIHHMCLLLQENIKVTSGYLWRSDTIRPCEVK